MKYHLVPQPIHGLSYAQLTRSALVWAGLIAYDRGNWVLSEEYWGLKDGELNDILNQYLNHRDQ